MTERFRKLWTHKMTWVWLAAGCFVLLLILRMQNILSRSPEYDELWTLQNYVPLSAGRILTAVATPNNHVLNTLGIKWSMKLFGASVWALRLPALLGFAGLFVLLLRGLGKFCRSGPVRGATLAAALLDGMILHYAETARGYSLQTFFVFGFLLALLCFSTAGEKGTRARVLNAGAGLLCALGCCLAVSSGILFVTIIAALWWLLFTPFRRGFKAVWQEQRVLLIAGAAFTVFVLLWYGGNFSAFAAGRDRFGVSFASLPQYMNYAWGILWSSGLLWALLLLSAGAWRFRGRFAGKVCSLAGGAAALTLLSALVTKGGPVRVCLPLLPPAWFGAGIALDEFLNERERLKRFGIFILLAAMALAVLFSDSRRLKYSDPDLGVVFRNLRQTVAPDIVIAYRPTDLYVIASLFSKEAREDHVTRLAAPRFLLLLHDNVLGAMRFADSSTVAFAPGCAAASSGEAGEGVSYWVYPLRKLRRGEKLNGHPVLCVMHGLSPELSAASNWLKKDFAAVNSFLNSGLIPLNLPPRYLFVADGAQVDSGKLLDLEAARTGRLLFLVPGN